MLRDLVKLLFNHIGTAKFLRQQAGSALHGRQATFFADHFEWLKDHTSLTSDESAILHLNESLCLFAQGKDEEAGRCLETIRNGCDPVIRERVEHVKLVMTHRRSTTV